MRLIECRTLCRRLPENLRGSSRVIVFEASSKNYAPLAALPHLPHMLLTLPQEHPDWTAAETC
jgi:hypothetical protein